MALEDAKSQVDTAFTRAELRGLSSENTFGGAQSFMRRRYTKDLGGADIAVTGVPFDQAVTNRPGARFGPRAIREASTLQAFDQAYGWPFDVFTDHAVIDYGDLAFDYANIPEFPAALTTHISTILEAGAASVTLGGDHFITLPILRAYAAKYGPIAFIQVDAHTDTWPDDTPDRIDHGTFLYKAIREGLIDVAHSSQIGIRTFNDDTLDMPIIDAPEFHRLGPDAVAAQVRERVGTQPCYLSFDIDGLDPAFAPGTGTPVWGGLSSAQAAALLRGLAGINLRGGDVVEVSPPYDTTGATAVAGAHVAVELCCLLGWRLREGL